MGGCAITGCVSGRLAVERPRCLPACAATTTAMAAAPSLQTDRPGLERPERLHAQIRLPLLNLCLSIGAKISAPEAIAYHSCCSPMTSRVYAVGGFSFRKGSFRKCGHPVRDLMRDLERVN